MAEIGISVAAKVAEYTVVPVLRLAISHARYLFCADKIKRNFDATKTELNSRQESVLKQKEEARNRNEITVEVVEEWLNEVSKVMEEVGQLEEQMREGSSCCWDWCSTLKGYHLCKQFAKITDSMKRLNQNGEFNPFSHPIPIPDIEFFSSENFVWFESTKSASKQLLEALQDDGVNMIGLYGMGGCGKTTLAKEVGKKAKELKLFDHVVFTVVSKSVIVTQIQNEIAELLNFKLQYKTEVGRARELSLRLQYGEKILIILDDIWSSFNLEEGIGIPLHNNGKGCKVLLTTRLQQVCALMGCRKKIQLSLLSYQEAWTLFQNNTHVVDESVARDIVKECKGLAIGIVAVARSLKDRSLDVWRVALKQLRTSKPIDVVEGERDAYSCLKLSYDHLQKDEAKLLLKICSMFPEDHNIALEELFRYGIGLGMCEKEDSFEEARSIVNAAIDDLVCSSLLFYESYRGGKFFKIHDLVRDVCLWIASKEDGTIMVDPERGFNAISENGSIKDCYAVSLWHKGIDQFPQHLDAPKLQILLLNSEHNLDFSDASLEGIKELKVMSVINNEFLISSSLSLPSPTQWQLCDKLHTLRLVDKEIGDISFVVNLRRLKILDLNGSVLKKLPNGIAYLNELKLMDLSDCEIEEEEDCSEVIGRCSQLQELYMPLEIALPYECFLCDTFRKLQRYRLNICHNNFDQFSMFQIDCAREFRVVSIGNMNVSHLCSTVQDLLKRASSVCVDGLVGGCKSIIPDFVQGIGTLNELTKLCLRSCSEIECIIDTTTFDNADSFRVDAKSPMLVKLLLKHMDNLKEVIRGPSSLPCLLEKLEFLWIEDCQNLTSLFSYSVAQSLQQLNFLTIKNCYKLKHIIIKEEKNETDTDEKEIFPNLKHVGINGCIELEYIFPIFVARTLLSLDYLSIGECWQLKHIIKNEGEGDTTTQVIRKNEERLNRSSCQPCFPKLRELRVMDCNELKCLFSASVVANLPQLKELVISNATQLEQAFRFTNEDVTCNTEKIMLPNLSMLTLEMLPNFVDICLGLEVHAVKLQQMVIDKCPKFDSIHQWSTQESSFLHGSTPEEGQEKIITPNLGLLYLKDLLDLMSIWKGPTLINFQNLVLLKVVACRKLKFIFPACVVRNLPTLKCLIIKDCEELEQVFDSASENHDGGKVFELALPKLAILGLFRLPRFTNFGGDLQFQLKLKALKCYEVQDCPKLSSTSLATLENCLPHHKSDTDNDLYLDIGYDGFDTAVRFYSHFDEPNEANSKEESEDANSDKKE